MATRTLRERALQTLAFEALGIALVTPAFMALSDGHAGESLALMVAITLAVLIWAPLYGFIFDRLEQRKTGRIASDRPQAVRLLHAVLYELTSVSMTLPLAMILGGLTMNQALGLNIGLTVFYIGYAYVFFLIYDWLRPVQVAS